MNYKIDTKLVVYLLSSIILFTTIEKFRYVITTFNVNYYIKHNIRVFEIFFIIIWISFILLYKVANTIVNDNKFRIGVYSFYGIYFLSLIFIFGTNKMITTEEITSTNWNTIFNGVSSLSYEFYPVFLIVCLWGLLKLIIHIKKSKCYLLSILGIPTLMNIILLIFLIISNNNLSYPYFVFGLYLPITAIVNILTAIGVLVFIPSKIEFNEQR